MKIRTISLLSGVILLLGGCTSEASDLGIVVDSPPESSAEEPAPDPRNVNSHELGRVIAQFNPARARNGAYTVSEVCDANREKAVYVVNFDDDGGFMLVSAKKDYYPLLAFNDTGHFDVAAMEDAPVRYWLENTADDVTSILALQPDSVEQYRSMWRQYEIAPMSSDLYDGPPLTPSELTALKQIIEKKTLLMSDAKVYTVDQHIINSYGNGWYSDLSNIETEVLFYIYEPYCLNWKDLTRIIITESQSWDLSGDHRMYSTWDQEYNFNQSFPIITENSKTFQAVVGCVGIAAGQVMRYHRHPSKYNWDDMPLTYATKTTSDFLYSIVSRANPKYSIEGTSISLSNMKDVLKSDGYQADVKGFSEATVKTDLRQGRPVILGLRFQKTDNTTGKHAIVIEACKAPIWYKTTALWTFTGDSDFSELSSYTDSSRGSEYYYLNWGWFGDCDGYYLNLKNVYPRPYATSGDAKEILYNIKPLK